MLGEAPLTNQVSAEIQEIWGHGRQAAAMTRECWRSVYRAQSSLGRTCLHEAPLYQPDRLIEEYALTPSTVERITAVVHLAVRNLGEVAERGSPTEYLQAKRRVGDALEGIQHLRYLRLGPQSLGVRGLDPEPPQRPAKRHGFRSQQDGR